MIAEIIRRYQGDESQVEYARRLKIAQPTLSQIYSGVRKPGRETITAFLRAFPEAGPEIARALTEAPEEPTPDLHRCIEAEQVVADGDLAWQLTPVAVVLDGGEEAAS